MKIFENFNRIIYSFLLTSLFYVPGLVYTLANLTIISRGIRGSIVCDQKTGVCKDIAEIPELNPTIPTPTKSTK